MLSRLAAAMSRFTRPAPASFAIVMATGIVAIAARQQGLALLSESAFGLDGLMWLALTATYLARLVWDHAAFANQWRDHAKAPGFLTAVAGTSVFAGSVLIFRGELKAATALAIWAALLWLVITYGVLAALTTREDKPALESGLNGSWLLAVVACQSIAVVCALLSPQYEQPARLQLNFCALALWLAGGMLYTWIIGLIFYRYLILSF